MVRNPESPGLLRTSKSQKELPDVIPEDVIYEQGVLEKA